MLYRTKRFISVTIVCLPISISAMAMNLSSPTEKSLLSPIITVNEYIGAPEASNILPVTYKSTDAGMTWRRNQINNATGRIRSISCNKGNYCVAVGEAYNNSKTTIMAYNSYDGGYTWTAHNLGVFGGTSGLESITCDETQHCVAVGAASPITKHDMKPIIFTSFDSGNSWTTNYQLPVDSQKSDAALSAVSCNRKNGMICIAVGHSYPDGNTASFISYASLDGGLTWSNKTIEDNLGVESLLSEISCDSDGKTCISIGHVSLDFVGQPANHNYQAVMYETRDSGNTWARINLPVNPSPNTSLDGITCNESHCIVVGKENNKMITLKNQGNTWIKVTPIIATSVYTIPVNGIQINQNIPFSVYDSGLDSVICDDNMLNCIAVGKIRYNVAAIADGKTIHKYINLPVSLTTKNSGETWQSTWPSIIDLDGQLHAIENSETEIASNIL